MPMPQLHAKIALHPALLVSSSRYKPPRCPTRQDGMVDQRRHVRPVGVPRPAEERRGVQGEQRCGRGSDGEDTRRLGRGRHMRRGRGVQEGRWDPGPHAQGCPVLGARLSGQPGRAPRALQPGQDIRLRQEVRGERCSKRYEFTKQVRTLARQHGDGDGDELHRFMVTHENAAFDYPVRRRPRGAHHKQRRRTAATRAGRPAQDTGRTAGGGQRAGHAGPANLQGDMGTAGPRLARRDREAI